MISRRRDCRPRSIQTFYDFARCEYIENTSNAYIDTLIKGSNKISIQLKYIFKKNSESTNSGFIFGSRVSNNERQYGFINSYTSQFRFGNNTSLTDYITDTDILVTLDNTEKHNELKILDSSNNLLHTLTTTNNSFSNNYNLYIFGMNDEGSLIAFKSTTKLYSCKIYENDDLVRDFIPMYRKSTKEYGLWDRVTEEFYVSPNGVKFTGGERVIADADDNLYYLKDYIKCNGTTNTFINLSKFTNLDNVEFEVYSNTAHDNFIGSRSGTPVRNHFQIAKWTNTRIDISFGQQSPASITSKNTGNKKFKIKLWERIIYLDNEKFYTCPNHTFTTNTVVSLGAVKGSSQPTSARFYWFKWWNKDKDLIYDMIPVQRISDGVWGMFCKVHLGFYPSNGSAQFTGG